MGAIFSFQAFKPRSTGPNWDFLNNPEMPIRLSQGGIYLGNQGSTGANIGVVPSHCIDPEWFDRLQRLNWLVVSNSTSSDQYDSKSRTVELSPALAPKWRFGVGLPNSNGKRRFLISDNALSSAAEEFREWKMTWNAQFNGYNLVHKSSDLILIRSGCLDNVASANYGSTGPILLPEGSIAGAVQWDLERVTRVT